ncbi:hypothetical protein [Photobacterium angustum]|nr:hypothetical protein [Photobacterium angustum]
MEALEIIESGMLMQLQDLGRYGVAEHGLSKVAQWIFMLSAGGIYC